MGLLDIYYASQAQLTVLDPDLVTQYPPTVTGTPNAAQNPGGPPVNFNPRYDSTTTYLSTTPSNVLLDSVAITNLDVENPGVQGGPIADIITQYPADVTGTPTNTQNPGGPVRRFSQPWLPSLKYISLNPVAGVTSGILRNTLPITNLDVEDPSVSGGPIPDIITQYPVNVSGTPTTTQNVGNVAPFTSGAPAQRFSQPWLPTLEYIISNPVAGATSGILRNTLPITNFDIEDPGVNGGPIADIVTQYPPLVTGTPNTTQNVSIFPPFSSGAPPSRFSQIWLPNTTYLAFNPIATNGSGKLYDTLPITNFDMWDDRVYNNYSDIVTNYPSFWTTGTPTYTQNVSNTAPFSSGARPKRFSTIWFPFNGGYAASNPVAGPNSGMLYNVDPNGNNSLKITNYDIEEPGVQGGTPYNSNLDPTIYPIDTNHTQGNRGWFPTIASASGKFFQNYAPASTYNDFIQDYI